MTHTVSVVTMKSWHPATGIERGYVRCWKCTCGRIGPEWTDQQATDGEVLRGGRRHVMLARRRK